MKNLNLFTATITLVWKLNNIDTSVAWLIPDDLLSAILP